MVARVVAGIFARVATEDAVGARWASEVARLQQRLEQSARMEAVAERRRQQELAAQVFVIYSSCLCCVVCIDTIMLVDCH